MSLIRENFEEQLVGADKHTEFLSISFPEELAGCLVAYPAQLALQIWFVEGLYSNLLASSDSYRLGEI